MTPQSKMPGRFLVLALSLILAFGAANCVRSADTTSGERTPVTEVASSSPGTAGEDVYYIQVDDILMIDGHRHVELSPLREYAVAKDGTITLVFLGRVKAEGLTKRQLEDTLQNLYDPKYFKNLVITVEVKSKSYNIGGAVRTPGIKTLVLKTTVLTAILSAGGPTDFAKLDKVTVSRDAGDKRVQYRIDCDAIIKGKAPDNFLIQPNDFVWVPESRGIFGL